MFLFINKVIINILLNLYILIVDIKILFVEENIIMIENCNKDS